MNPRNSYASAWTDCDTQTQIPSLECQALVALYTSTNGPSRGNNTDWLQTDTPCSRYGVDCVNNHVYSIVLNGNFLSGPIPTEI